jgi:hypothetical protein
VFRSDRFYAHEILRCIWSSREDEKVRHKHTIIGVTNLHHMNVVQPYIQFPGFGYKVKGRSKI